MHVPFVHQLTICGFSVADTLLWKNKRQTLTVLLMLVAIYYNFIASGSTIVTTLSKLLLVSLIFLFIHGSLPNRMYVYLPTFNSNYSFFWGQYSNYSNCQNFVTRFSRKSIWIVFTLKVTVISVLMYKEMDAFRLSPFLCILDHIYWHEGWNKQNFLTLSTIAIGYKCNYLILQIGVYSRENSCIKLPLIRREITGCCYVYGFILEWSR